MLDPRAVADAALAGVRENEGIVVTHPHLYRKLIEERHQRLMDAFDAAERRR